MKHGRMTEKQVYESFNAIQASRRAQQDRMIERWSANTVGTKKLLSLFESNPTKARNTAMALQMQEAHLKTMSENIISTTFSLRPENLLKVVRIGVANSNRGDIFTEYPLQTTDDVLFYIWMTYEQSLRGATAAQRIYENINPFYAGEQAISATLATGDGGTTNFTLGAVSPLGLIPHTVRVIVADTLVGNDNGTGTLIGANLDTTAANTIDYATGIAVLNFVTAPVAGAAIKLMYNWNSEVTGNYASLGTVGITLEKKRFNARPMPLGYSFSTMTELTLGTTGIGNAEDLLVSAVGDEHAKSRDYKAIMRARQIANGNATSTFDTNFAAVGELSQKSRAQQVIRAIENAGADIYDSIKRGKINKVVAGSKATNYLKLHDLWKDDNSQPRSGVYKAGSLSDIDIYTCPADSTLVANNEMLLTFKNPQEGMDVTLVFGVLTEIAASLKFPQFYTQGNIATVEDSLVINSSFVKLLTLQNLSNN